MNFHFFFSVSYRERSQAKRRKRAVDSDSNIYLYFNLYKCLYPDCEPPADPNTLPPEDVRPNNAVYWNETSSWPNGTLPVDGDCLAIPEGTYICICVFVCFYSVTNAGHITGCKTLLICLSICPANYKTFVS